MYKHPRPYLVAFCHLFELADARYSWLGQICKNMVRKWVEDLVLTKTFTGFRFQESILKATSETKGVKYRAAKPEEESKGIGGFIGEIPVSIKPITYKTMSRLQENIEVKMIYYEKLKEGIRVEYDF